MSIFGSDRINNESQIDYNRRMKEHDRIWNAAIEAAANKIESAGNILLAHSVRELRK